MYVRMYDDPVSNHAGEKSANAETVPRHAADKTANAECPTPWCVVHQKSAKADGVRRHAANKSANAECPSPCCAMHQKSAKQDTRLGARGDLCWKVSERGGSKVRYGGGQNRVTGLSFECLGWCVGWGPERLRRRAGCDHVVVCVSLYILAHFPCRR